MTIWLVGKSIEELTKIPLVIGEERIKVRPNLYNEVYKFKDLLIHYELEKEMPEFTRFNRNIAYKYGYSEGFEHSFKDVHNKFQKLGYWKVGIWDAIPEKFRDIIFLHEIVELENGIIKKIDQPKAHKVAVEATEKYILRNLSCKERGQFKEYLEKLEDKTCS